MGAVPARAVQHQAVLPERITGSVVSWISALPGNLALIKLEKHVLRSDIAGDLHGLHRTSEADL